MPCFVFQLFPALKAAEVEPAPPPWGPQDWGPDEQRGSRGTVSGNPKLARVQLLRRQRPRGESPQPNAPTSVREVRSATESSLVLQWERIAKINESHSHQTFPKGSGLTLIRTFLLSWWEENALLDPLTCGYSSITHVTSQSDDSLERSMMTPALRQRGKGRHFVPGVFYVGNWIV